MCPAAEQTARQRVKASKDDICVSQESSSFENIVERVTFE
jgi:hypothetical protein